MSIYEDIKAAMQNLLAPDIQEIKGELKAVNARVDAIGKVMEANFAMTNQKIAKLELANALRR